MTDQLTSNITFHESGCGPNTEVIRLDKEGFHYRGQFIADAGEAHRLMVEFLRQNTQPEPQGPPKNCWLDDEPDLCPSPCVFDDPSEVIENCVYARTVKCKTDCKYYRTTQQPEPQGPTDEELMQLLFDDYRGVIEFVCDVEEEAHVMADSHVKFARAVLTRWGRPAIEPVPVTERLPGPEDCDAELCWIWNPETLWWELISLRLIRLNAGDPYTHWLPHHALPVPQQEVDCG